MKVSREQIVKELWRPARKNFVRRKMCIRGLNEHWSADLADFQAYSRKNKGYKFILLVIDSLSKFIYCEPLKNKTAICVRDAFAKIFKRSKVYPRHIQTDLGKEFYNSKLKELFEKHNINHYSTFSIIKSSFAERAIRSIKRRIFMNFALRGRNVYHDVLQKIVNEYNNTVHSKIKVKPAEVDEKIAQKLLKTVFYEPKLIMKKPKFSIGEYVRISKQKTFFEKGNKFFDHTKNFCFFLFNSFISNHFAGYTSAWRSEIFKVKKINYTNPITYLIEDLKNETVLGCFYEEELAKTNCM